MTPKIDDYTKWSYIKRRHGARWGLFSVVFFLLSIMLVFVLSDFISGIISGRGSILYSGKITLSSYSLYAIDVGSFKNESEAKTLSDNIYAQGGAGYVYKSGDYHVFVAMYETLSAAQEIKANLEADGFASKIYTINLPQINMKLSKDEQDIEEAVKYLKGLYHEIYNLSIDYDSRVASKLSIVASMTELKKKVDVLSQKVYDIVLANNKSEAILIRSALEKASLALSDVITFTSDDKTFNGEIKRCYFAVTFTYLNLSKEIG